MKKKNTKKEKHRKEILEKKRRRRQKRSPSGKAVVKRDELSMSEWLNSYSRLHGDKS